MTLPAGIRLIDYDKRYADATVAMWRASKEQALGIPEAHSFDDHVWFLDEILAPQNRTCLAVTENDDVVGFMATDGNFLKQLYIHPDYQCQGIGSTLLDLAKKISTGNLKLYTFEINLPAQKFYEKHDFEIVGGGSDNEEQLPDLLYQWCKL